MRAMAAWGGRDRASSGAMGQSGLARGVRSYTATSSRGCCRVSCPAGDGHCFLSSLLLRAHFFKRSVCSLQVFLSAFPPPLLSSPSFPPLSYPPTPTTTPTHRSILLRTNEKKNRQWPVRWRTDRTLHACACGAYACVGAGALGHCIASSAARVRRVGLASAGGCRPFLQANGRMLSRASFELEHRALQPHQL